MTTTEIGTRTRILDVAERLVQTRGFNGFSYADISQEIGISKASLHYHFPTKAVLVESLVERYERDFREALGWIDKRHDHALEKLKAYVGIYVRVLKADRMCLCGMLAADYTTLPQTIRARVRHFFETNEDWLTVTLSRGRVRKEVAFANKPAEAAHFLASALEGAMLLARAHESVTRFRSITASLLKGLEPAPV
mgnify:CR=1 FL=1